MNYCILFPEAMNVHLIKDVGMIGYKLNKIYGYNAFVASYNNDEYSYLKKEVKGLKIDFIEKKYNNDILDSIRYLKRKAKKIDVLQIFHITARSVFFAFFYKRFNSKGKILLKLDCTERLIDRIKGLNSVKLHLLNRFLDKIDVISVEQKRLLPKLTGVIVRQSEKLLLLPNGIDYDTSEKYKEIDFINKKSILITVGRIGSKEKGNDMLLNAFANIPNILESGWTFVQVGPLESSFMDFHDKFFLQHPDLKEIILFKGPIYDREKLYEEYSRAKIFCLGSEFESFGIALLEAASFGDVIISTDVGIASEIISKENGILVAKQQEEDFSKGMEKLMNCKHLEELSKRTEELCRKGYNWDEIVKGLNDRLTKVV